MPDDAEPTAGMARHLTDPVIEEQIQAFIATAPPLPEDLRAWLARLLRTDQCQRYDQRYN